VNSDSSELLNSYFSLLTSPQDRQNSEICFESATAFDRYAMSQCNQVLRFPLSAFSSHQLNFF
jgi:hypothetical protein